MDLNQRKLTKPEWDSLEVPVSSQEIEILRLIIEGYSNINIRKNNAMSILGYLSVEFNQQIEDFLYVIFFADRIKQLVATYAIPFVTFNETSKTQAHQTLNIGVRSIVKLKSTDQIRLSRVDPTNDIYKNLYDYVLFGNLEKLIIKKAENDLTWMMHYYTLANLLDNSVDKVNRYVLELSHLFLAKYEEDVNLAYLVEHAYQLIEQNVELLKYADLTLYEHQKQLYTIAKVPTPKLVLYTAPTGTGKTLSPLGLSEDNKIIFVCAARHVGMALAKSAISVGKRVAFAFGCTDASDVRLHWFSAKEYTTDKRSGRIKKVDNTVGDKVEIMICDIRSYLPAMYYMTSFNRPDKIITYWDEPTITLDYDDHHLHDIIKQNWSQNVIPNMVLSSATLPKSHEISATVGDFLTKFRSAQIVNIDSYDCKKTIPLIDSDGYVTMPHYLTDDNAKIKEIVSNCEKNLTLLRYFDLKECAAFVTFAQQFITSGSMRIGRNFASVKDIKMLSLKIYYLKVLKNLSDDNWLILHNHFKSMRQKYLPCDTNNAGVFVTTRDAYTLTDGPTIFLADGLQKVAKFCIQQATIPASVIKDINEKITFNNQLNERIDELEKQLELEERKIVGKFNTGATDTSREASKLLRSRATKDSKDIATKIMDKTEDRKLMKIKDDIDAYKTMVKRASLDDMFVPNKLAHLERWAPKGRHSYVNNAFTSNIGDDIITKIMLLKGIDDSWKILLLLGIGVFTEHSCIAYTEIMKELAEQQHLYLIIADSDYIYGTNYQFCHGYLSKDLALTQEKIIQALGRIGRNNIQQTYSARFRDDSHIFALFNKINPEDKKEVVNMNRLFCSTLQN